MPEEVFFSVPAELEAALEVTVTVEEDEDEEPIVPPFVDMSPEPSPPAAPGQKPLPPPGTLTTLDFAYSVSNALKANKPVSTGDLTLALADAKKFHGIAKRVKAKEEKGSGLLAAFLESELVKRV